VINKGLISVGRLTGWRGSDSQPDGCRHYEQCPVLLLNWSGERSLQNLRDFLNLQAFQQTPTIIQQHYVKSGITVQNWPNY